MNDDRLLLEMRRWLQGERVALPDAEEAGQQIAARLPTTRQRRRRPWWRPPFRTRTTAPPAATDTTDYQPAPIPASNGHTPNVIGRTQSMLSPAKAITAGAIIFAIGSALLVAQPFQQQGTTPGAEGDVLSEPVAFTASYFYASMRPGERSTPADGIQRTTDEAWVFASREATDPRFEGNLVVNASYDKYDEVQLTTHVFRIENEAGAWHYGPFVRMTWNDRETPDDAYVEAGETEQQQWVGEGAYEGLVAVVVSTEVVSGGGATQLEGYVVDGALPPPPQPYSPVAQN